MFPLSFSIPKRFTSAHGVSNRLLKRCSRSALALEAAEAVPSSRRHGYRTSHRPFCRFSEGILIYGQRMEFARLPPLTFPPIRSISGYSYETIPIRTTCPCNSICHFCRRLSKRRAGPTFRTAWQSTVCQSKHARATSWFWATCRRSIGPAKFWTRPKPAIFKRSFKSSRRRSCECRCASSRVLEQYRLIRARLCGPINRWFDHLAATI